MASKPVKIFASLLGAGCVVGGTLALGQGQPIPIPSAPSPSASPQADRPETRPQRPGDIQPSGGGERTMGWLFDRVGGKAAGQAPTDEEWRQTSQLLSGMSPARWQVFEQVLDKPHRADRAKRFLFSKYAEIHELEQLSPKRYEGKVEQVKLEDEIFKLDTDLHASKSPGETGQLKSRLRDKVNDWVTKDFDERETRLKQLQERLDRERASLEAERLRTDEIVERRVEVVRRSSERFRAWAAGLPIEPGDGPFRRPMKGGDATPAPLPPDNTSHQNDAPPAAVPVQANPQP